MTKSNVFPYKKDTSRLEKYRINQALLEGDHYTAFAMAGDKHFGERYNRLRYVVGNFCGLVSKVNADVLFGESVQIADAGDAQDFIEKLFKFNNMPVQLYESAITASALGDTLFKIRTSNENIYVESLDPSIYFPEINSMSMRQTPEMETLAWVETVEVDAKPQPYLVQEIHTPGLIEIKVNVLVGDEGKSYSIKDEVEVASYNRISGKNYQQYVETGIDETMLVYVPNNRLSTTRYWGDSDYIDIKSLQFSLNNRLTVIDNILDKHQDPILAVPDGVVDENGLVRKDWLDVIELGDDGQKPEYITWNANLESAFTQIDKLLEMMFMSTETTPDVLGMGQGQAESGRALKMRLIRTLAKRNRKQLYFEAGMRKIARVAQKLGLEGYKVMGDSYKGQVEDVSFRWSDGIVNDRVEDTEVEIKRVQGGIQTKLDAIKNLDDLTDEQAEAKVQELRIDSGAVAFPSE